MAFKGNERNSDFDSDAKNGMRRKEKGLPSPGEYDSLHNNLPHASRGGSKMKLV